MLLGAMETTIGKKGSLLRAAHKNAAEKEKKKCCWFTHCLYNCCRVDTNRAAVLVGDGEKHMLHIYTVTLLIMYILM